MTDTELPEQTTRRIVRETRAVASLLTFDQRAHLLREVAHELYDAVKFDPLMAGSGPDEQTRLGELYGPLDDYYFETLKASQNQGTPQA